MESARPFAPVAEVDTAGEFYALVSGEKLETYGAPARLAWEIERLAALRGWPAGETLGSAADLRTQLNAGRDTLRQAIRIVESRGAMRMRRGRAGGLVMLCPPVEQVAASLATYFRAIGFTREQFDRSVRGLDQLLAWQLARTSGALAPPAPGETPRHWLARVGGRQTYLIYLSALDQLAPLLASPQPVAAALRRAAAEGDAAKVFGLLGALPFVRQRSAADTAADRSPFHAAAIASAMLEQAGSGRPLGNEALLCEQFETSRTVVRQALRILQDLDLVSVRLGRGGGYDLKQPSPIGIIRQLFVWLAARNCDPFALTQIMWDLNAANVRLAGETLAGADVEERNRYCDRIRRELEVLRGQARFIHFQQALARIADCPMIDTLARCIVSYQARSCSDIPVEAETDDLFTGHEIAIVEALRAADLDLAERILRSLQDRMEEVAIEMLGLREAAE